MMKRMRALRAAAAIAAVLLGGAGAVAVAAPASAGVVGSCHRYQFFSSRLEMTVVDNADGGRIVQQWPTPDPKFTWCLLAAGGTVTPEGPFLLQNQWSTGCLATDGVSGHRLQQRPCNRNLPIEQWFIVRYANWNGQDLSYLANVQTGDLVNVGGGSLADGAEIIGWHLWPRTTPADNELVFEI
ncbi:RICIN domain-containing protein [Dactylosporangium sp. NPDC051541]|uniref:RICIN domain-containing protein n=1 Tax=Dactylosporangium sp. NPDC051541 TaxID=3363977 RepID=UPI00378C6FB7